MKKLLICLLVLVSNSIYSQHCPYDFSSIIIVKIHTRENQNTIPNLKVTLIKKKKDKVVKSKDYILTQNNRFPFLTDEYSLVVGNSFDVENYYLKIESVCEFSNDEWSRYHLTEINLSKNDINGLCDHYDSSAENFHYSDGRVYKPIEIILRKQSCK